MRSSSAAQRSTIAVRASIVSSYVPTATCGDATSQRDYRLGLGHLGDALAAVVDEIGLHHDRRAPNVQWSARGVDGPLAHTAEEVGLRLDRRGVRPRRQVEE